MRVLLVMPKRDYISTKFPSELLSIAAVLELHGHQVKIADYNLSSAATEDYSEYKPELIGFSVATGCISHAIEKSIEFKTTDPKTKIVWGFRHPSALPEQTISELYVDYVIVGAGEFTLTELCARIEAKTDNYSDINGLVYKLDGRIIINPRRPFPINLDELPDPAWHLVDVKNFWDIDLTTSWGCPLNCTFCSNDSFYSGQVINLSAARIISQMERLYREHGVKYLMLTGDNFTIDKGRLHDFCRLAVERRLKVKWNCQVSSLIDAEDAKMMAQAGCTAVILGVESGSQRILNLVNKGVVEQFEETYWNLVNQHIIPTIFFQYGFPTECSDDFLSSLAMLKRMDNPPYYLMKFVPYPKTKLFDYCVANQLIPNPDTLEKWSSFYKRYTNSDNLSLIPNHLIDSARSTYTRDFASRRFRFMIRHNPGYFKKAITQPKEFWKSFVYLVRNYMNAVFSGKTHQ